MLCDFDTAETIFSSSPFVLNNNNQLQAARRSGSSMLRHYMNSTLSSPSAAVDLAPDLRSLVDWRIRTDLKYN